MPQEALVHPSWSRACFTVEDGKEPLVVLVTLIKKELGTCRLYLTVISLLRNGQLALSPLFSMGTRHHSTMAMTSAVLTSVVLDTMAKALINICGHAITTTLESMSAILKPDQLNTSAVFTAKTYLETGLTTLTFSGLMINLCIAIILFRAHLGLEQCLPTRCGSSYSQPDEQAIGKVTDDDPTREDEIVKRLIAQGKIRRASVSWINIVLKWVVINLLTSCLSVWSHSLVTALRYRVRLTSLLNVHSLIAPILQSIFASFSPASMACFISLVAVPAQHRQVSISAATLLAATLLSAFVLLNIDWVVSTGLVRQLMMEAIDLRDNADQGGPVP